MKDENDNIIISQVIKYINAEKENKDYYNFIIIANDQMLAQIKNNFVDQFFMDCTYRAVLPNIYKCRLMLIVGFDSNKKNSIMQFYLIKKWKETTFKIIFE